MRSVACGVLDASLTKTCALLDFVIEPTLGPHRRHPSASANLHPVTMSEGARKTVGILVAIGGPALTAGVSFVTVLVESFAFDSPLRRTSTGLVMSLLLAAAGGEALGSIALGMAIYRHRSPGGRAYLIGGAFVAILGLLCHAASLGFALFGS